MIGKDDLKETSVDTDGMNNESSEYISPLDKLAMSLKGARNHENKSYALELEANRLFIPLMNDFVANIAAKGIADAEDNARLLNVIIGTIDRGYGSFPPETRSKILKISLEKLLESIEHDISCRSSQQSLELPKEAIHPYIPKKSGPASEFLKKHWGDYIEAGVMFRPDLTRLDPKLAQALINEFRGRAEELRAILPTKSDAVDARIERELGGPVRPEKRAAAQSALRFAKAAKQ